ncbi:hypothetical protein, partial [Pseudomonas fluorescens]|uniref:hypothetical protein n=1 Tax=Pseudomonas fluorescens TaxID=294 RepID=UPI001E4ACC70
VYLFDFGVGSHHELLAPEKNREHSIADQQLALNVVFMDRIRNTDHYHISSSATQTKTLAHVK